MSLHLAAILFTIVLLPGLLNAAGPSYRVERITDGDTLEASDGNLHFKVRLAGIDAPEKNQPFGKVAKEVLARLVSGKSVGIEYLGLDPYNRIIGRIISEGQDVSLLLMLQGLAFYYRPGCVDYEPDRGRHYTYDIRPYVKAEQDARAKKVGMYAVAVIPELPCMYRHNKKAHSK